MYFQVSHIKKLKDFKIIILMIRFHNKLLVFHNKLMIKRYAI